MLDHQVLALGLRPFPDSAFRTTVVARIGDHVDQLVTLYAVKPPDRSLMPAVNPPFDGFEQHQWNLQVWLLHPSGEWQDLAQIILEHMENVRLVSFESIDEAHACCL